MKRASDEMVCDAERTMGKTMNRRKSALDQMSRTSICDLLLGMLGFFKYASLV